MGEVVWVFALGFLAVGAVILLLRRGGSRINRGRDRLDLYADALPLELVATLHDHAHLLLEVQLAVSPQNRSWKAIEALAEIMTALRRSAAIKTDPTAFTLAQKNRYRRDLGVAVAALATKRWKSEFEKDEGERHALRPFRMPSTIARGEHNDEELEEHIERMGALV